MVAENYAKLAEPAKKEQLRAADLQIKFEVYLDEQLAKNSNHDASQPIINTIKKHLEGFTQDLAKKYSADDKFFSTEYQEYGRIVCANEEDSLSFPTCNSIAYMLDRMGMKEMAKDYRNKGHKIKLGLNNQTKGSNKAADLGADIPGRKVLSKSRQRFQRGR